MPTRLTLMSASSGHSAGLKLGFCVRSHIESPPIGAPQAIAQVCPSVARGAFRIDSGSARQFVRGITAERNDVRIIFLAHQLGFGPAAKPLAAYAIAVTRCFRPGSAGSHLSEFRRPSPHSVEVPDRRRSSVVPKMKPKCEALGLCSGPSKFEAVKASFDRSARENPSVVFRTRPRAGGADVNSAYFSGG